jgi:hypothetical protein
MFWLKSVAFLNKLLISVIEETSQVVMSSPFTAAVVNLVLVMVPETSQPACVELMLNIRRRRDRI